MMNKGKLNKKITGVVFWNERMVSKKIGIRNDLNDIWLDGNVDIQTRKYKNKEKTSWGNE